MFWRGSFCCWSVRYCQALQCQTMADCASLLHSHPGAFAMKVLPRAHTFGILCRGIRAYWLRTGRTRNLGQGNCRTKAAFIPNGGPPRLRGTGRNGTEALQPERTMKNRFWKAGDPSQETLNGWYSREKSGVSAQGIPRKNTNGDQKRAQGEVKKFP